MNLLTSIAPATDAEAFDTIIDRPGIRVERIVSHGHASPPGFWYDDALAEWVLVLKGRARLRFADEPADRALDAGDALEIAPHRRHRVEWTDPLEPTVWLAVYYADTAV